MQRIHQKHVAIFFFFLGALSCAFAAGAAPSFVNAANPDLPEVAQGVPMGGALEVFGLELDQVGVTSLELERFRGRLGALSQRQQEAVEALTRAVIQKILHRPIRHLKASVDRGDTAECAMLYREIFGMSVDGDAEPAADTQPRSAGSSTTPPSPRRRDGSESAMS